MIGDAWGLRPDPPTGLSYADFQAARARFFNLLREQSEINRLNQAWRLPAAEGGNSGSVLPDRGSGSGQSRHDRPAS